MTNKDSYLALCPLYSENVIYWASEIWLCGSRRLILWLTEQNSLVEQKGEVTWAVLRKRWEHFSLPFQKRSHCSLQQALYPNVTILTGVRRDTEKTYGKCWDICLSTFTVYNVCSRQYWGPRLGSILQHFSLLKIILQEFSLHLKSATNVCLLKLRDA